MAQERLFLDRIEEGIAVLLPEGGGAERHLPAGDLPADAQEGDWLIASDAGGEAAFTVDSEKTRQMKNATQSLMDELLGQPPTRPDTPS